MATTWNGARRPGVAVAALVLAFLAVPARAADDDEALRKKALELNKVTGTKAADEKFISLLRDAEGTRKLLAVASRMAKEKDQPFNVNATIILARAAHFFKQPEVAEQFYRLNKDQAVKLLSGERVTQAYEGLASLYLANKKYAECEKLCREFLGIDEGDDAIDRKKPTILRVMLTAQAKGGDADKALETIDRLIKKEPENWLNIEFKGRLLRELDQKEDAAKIYEVVLDRIAKEDRLKDKEKDQFLADIHYILSGLYGDLKQSDKVVENLKAALEKSANDKPADESPEDQLVSRVMREVGRTEEAAKVWEEAIDRLQKDKDEKIKEKAREKLIGDIRYALSNVYVDLKQVDKAADHLKALLEKHPDNPTYNNDLGYIWADHDKNLEESERLIRKALDEDRKLRHKANPDLKPEEDQDNPAYLDSLGWVLFKLKKYQEAKKYLLEAVKQEDGQHAEILDHLGDIHMALGEKAAAVAVWKKAVEVAGDSKREQARKAEVEKKLKANQ
jgi:tetratricopeptide (TPR) repeat protein